MGKRKEMKKILWAVIASVLLFVSNAAAIIFFDVDGDLVRLGDGGGGGGLTRVATYSSSTVSGSTVTVSSVNAGAGDFVLILSGWRANNSQLISGVTFNGSATGISEIVASAVTNGAGAGAWQGDGLTGTADIVVTWDVAPDNGASVVVHVFSGAHATTPIRDSDTASDGAVATAISPALTSATDDLCYDMIGFRVFDDLTSLAADAGQTELFELLTPNVAGASEENGAASVTMGWSWAGGNNFYGMVAACVRP